MAMDRWDPFRDVWTLRDAMDRLFQENFLRPTSALISGSRSYTPVDILENERGYVVRATIPGIRPDDIRVSVAGDTVTIHGESRDEDQQREDQNWILRERRSASFHRSITLPSPIDADHVEAHCEHGVLTLTLPRATQTQPRQIHVTSTPTGITSPSGSSAGASRQAPGQSSEGALPAAASTQAQDDRDAVMEASEASFPASDPPSYNPQSV